MAKTPAQPKPAENTAPKQSKPIAGPSRKKGRHWGLLLYFVILVVLPIAAAVWYLNTKAVDQYASTVAFTVRSEDVSSATDLLGGLGSTFSGSTSTDTDILYEFIRSQPLVAAVDERVDLKSIYSPPHETDPIFGLNPDSTIEEMTDYWQRMVRVSYDASSGLMELRVLAFNPEDATTLAQVIFEESSAMINDLSAIAREDATRYAREDLDLALERLKGAREALTSFRIANEIVDPSADIQGQVGLVNTLQAQLAEALIELDLLTSSTRAGDPRLVQTEKRVEVIEERIRQERRKFGVGSAVDDSGYATTIAEFERLAVDREFAEQAYGLALAAFDSARAEANRQSRYLAAYIEPTMAEKSEFPQRLLMIFIVALFSFLIWSIGSLAYYALRDRR
ncbi:capsular polysaccharide transport system permease protein [Cognatiyoonia sediminum]|uniref:Capsular polysaccharide transport system permease protein n=1 Tax=Cognatiyoonia sediminum TaxID=1508389 RepID=A0A1M5QT65_9RHOB|nr:hypothetical protein [Cognatiyoonia sediminum]SHH17056.1 capsular polysaccharide transport system permease protein [Cognatiyoonia sediminum]